MKTAIELAQDLIRIPSVTPDGGAVLDYVESVLKPAGFTCIRKVFDQEGTASVDNLYARFGTGSPHFMFAGHVDVVPPGNMDKWTTPAFEPTLKDGYLYGRGAEDMKGAIGCFIAAALRVIQTHPKGSISLLLTSDEEGVAINGSRKLVPWLKETQEVPDACLVGEPTNPSYIGEMVKIGRRGSLYFTLHIQGKQGHVAYQHLADNPITRLAAIIYDLKSQPLDGGNDFFLPSNLEVTSVTSSEAAQNVIPAEATAKMSVRFNTLHTADSITAWIQKLCEKHAPGMWVLTPRLSGDPFLTQPGALSTLVSEAIQTVTGHLPELSTTGGTSDARFIKDICPVVEFGTTNLRAHHIDERVKIEDLDTLSNCYAEILRRFLA